MPRRSAISAAFRCHNEAELVAVPASARDKGVAVSLVLESGINPAPLSIAGHTVSFEVAQVRVNRLARQPTHPDGHAARAAG